jgi:hypothetical protein
MPVGKPTAREAVDRMLAKLPAGSSAEEIQYHLGVLQHIERGRRDIVEGRVLSADEIERRMARLGSDS